MVQRVVNQNMQKVILISLAFGLGSALNTYAADSCNPDVYMSNKQTTLSEGLTYLAQKNGFKLSFPKSLDRKIVINESMPLDKMIKYLTSDLNTMLSYADSQDCTGKRITELIILPVGEETEFLTVQARSQQEKRLAKKQGERIYIEDMDVYYGERKAAGLKPEKFLMTREQVRELKAAKKRWNRNNKKR